MKYNKQSFGIRIGKIKDKIFEKRFGEIAFLEYPRGGWLNLALIGASRSFKSSLAKHIIVLTSKVRKVCVFDYKGEMQRDLIEYSKHPYCPYKQKLTDFKVLNNIACKISEIASDHNSLTALGFSTDGISYLKILVEEGWDFHKDDPEKFTELVNTLPTSKDELAEFNREYNLHLPKPIAYATAQSIINHWMFIKNWFYNPHKPNPEHNHYNFKDEFLKTDHLIIDLSLGDKGTNANRAMAICGFVLREFREINHITNPVYVIEEARHIIPSVDAFDDTDFNLPSSVKQVYDLMTLDPKYGVSIILIMQSELMIYKRLIEHVFARIVSRDPALDGGSDLANLVKKMNLQWVPNANYRELCYYDRTGKYFKFVPDIACCKV